MFQRQGAPDHAIADDEGRRSPDVQSFGEDGVPLDRRIQGGVLHVARKLLGIEVDGASGARDVIEVEGALCPQQRPVKRFVEAPRP